MCAQVHNIRQGSESDIHLNGICITYNVITLDQHKAVRE